METEIEAKWLDIDKDLMRQKLEICGAKLIAKERKMVRQIFDYPDMRLERVSGWVRVRDEGEKITMSYKQLNDRSLHGTKEVNLTIDDFDNACNFLVAIGLESNSIQETLRESWELNGASIEIDTWPWIPPMIEIEAKSEASLLTTAEKLGLELQSAVHGSVENAYTAIYDITEHDVDSWPEIKFSEVPDWLEAKRR